MRLSKFELVRADDAYEVSARLDWEDRMRESCRIYFRSSAALEGEAEDHVDAFLTAACVPAMVFGERRIVMDEAVCPTLRQNLNTALSWINHWFEFRKQPLTLDVATRNRALERPGRDVGAFFSGGIDAWSTFLRNRTAYSTDHPGSIRECIVVLGLQGNVSRANFLNAMRWFNPLAADMGVRFTGVETNVYSHWMDMDPGYRIWSKSFNGASLSSIGHLLSDRLGRVLIASSDNMGNLEPWGTHPLLDPNYSSHDLTVIHDGVGSTRLDKTRLVASSEFALRHLRVCDNPVPEGYLNCGVCEKCTRTMLTLESLGALERCPTFPFREITRQHIENYGNMKVEFTDYLELVPGLQARGRDDLLAGIDTLTRRWQERDLRGWLRRADRYLLGGMLRKRRDTLRNRGDVKRLAPGARRAND